MKKRRVVITGVGVITPIGIGKKEFWQALKKGKSGIVKLSRFDTNGYSSKIAGEIKDFEPNEYLDPKQIRRMDRFAQFAVCSAKIALEDSQLKLNGDNNKVIGIVMGSALGGMPYAESQHSIFMEKGINRVDPLLATKLFCGEASSQTSIELGIKGPTFTISTACAAGADAIGYGLTLIRNNKADIVIAGGAETPLAPMTFGAFCRLDALSKRNNNPEIASRPFDKDRDGFVMSEGAGVIVLEELTHALKRDAYIYAELVGFGATSDAYHMTRTDPNGTEFAQAIKLALQDANMKTKRIDYINAHGTSTPLNDKTETMVIKNVFGDRAYEIPISSTKSMIGHTLGACGAIEIIASVLTIKNQFIPPTRNYEVPDSECDLNYVPNKGINAELDVVLSNSLGFGSRNAAIIIKKFNG
jgi:3-oxoacyl-[acyl-carrier-protein] synthase II